jgi:hypothetical protein
MLVEVTARRNKTKEALLDSRAAIIHRLRLAAGKRTSLKAFSAKKPTASQTKQVGGGPIGPPPAFWP